MASLTPLSKGLIGLAVVGAMASAVWHLVLKERMDNGANPVAQTTSASVPVESDTGQTAPTQVVPTPNITEPAPPNEVAQTGSTHSSAAENFEKGRQLMDAGDYAQARKFLKAAIDAGDGNAACLLGEIRLKGLGGDPANQDAAAKLFQLAQSRGSICFAAAQ